MRVLLLSPYEDPASGVNVFVRRLAGGLRARGHLAGAPDLSAGAAPRSLRNLVLAIRSLVAVWRARRECDLVHLQQFHAQSLAAGLLARTLGKRVVVTVHGRSPTPRGVRRILLDLTERVCRRVPHAVVHVAESLRDWAGEGIVIRNGVPVASMHRGDVERERARRELGLGEEVALVFVGRVEREKGFDVLLEALDRVRAVSLHPVRLLAVGPVGEDVRPVLTADRAGSVDLLGFRPDPLPYVVAGDVFVLPSRHEGLPLSLLEAMALGLPAIGTRVGDLPSVVRPGATGWLVEPGDVPGLASAILECVADAGMRRALGSKAARLIAEEYNMDSVVRAYVDLYTHLCGGGPQRG